MKTRPSLRELMLFALITLGSSGAGVINGILGTGGGIILTLIYSRVTPSPKDAFVSAMATVVPISIVSLLTYSETGIRSVTEAVSLVIPSALGGILGAYLSTKVKSSALTAVFSLLVIYSGIRMINA